VAATDIPPNRWELSGDRNAGYAEKFTEMLDTGQDVDAEARLADVLAPRGARILDAGAGLGRVGAGLQRRGHQVTAVEKDPALITLCRQRFPDLPVVVSDILGLSPELLQAHGAPVEYDVITLVGNVIVLLAEGTEVRALRTLRDLLAPGGRILVGYHLSGGPAMGRSYPFAEFEAEAEATGLVVDQHFGSYELLPTGDRVVAVLSSRT
jgi:SAM-dependent methyltransferase